MNVTVLASMSVLVVFKTLKIQYGVSILDFMLARNVFNFCMAVILTRSVGINPLENFPKDLQSTLLTRVVVG